MDDHSFDAKSEEVRRIEVITGIGHRRRWTAEARAGRLARADEGSPSFVPVIADAFGRGMPVTGPAIEIEVRGMIVRMRGRVEASALAEVLAAVKSVR